MQAANRKSVSLVLGSGGARGLAHIGVIHELVIKGYSIQSIAGSSVGALVGGIYAAGKLDEFEHWVRAISKIDIVALLDFAWGKDGLVKGDKVINTLVNLVGDQMIENLNVPFTAVATDIVYGKEIWLRSGPLFDAIRASISLPLFFTPVQYKGRYLIDGGVLNPVPIAPTFNDGTDLTIAVNLGGPDEKNPGVNSQEIKEELEPASFLHNVNYFLDQLGATNKDKKYDKREEKKRPGAYDIASQAFDVMQTAIARQKLAAYPPDITIEIPGNACGSLEYNRAAEMIELGRAKTQEVLSQLKMPH